MAYEVDTRPSTPDVESLPADFADRLEESLRAADRERARRHRFLRLRRLLPLGLLIGPVIAWHVFLAGPGGTHTYVDLLAWLTFFLDVGVHGDSAVLSYLGLQALPTIVGFLLLLLLTVTLLGGPDRRDR
jgi:hypothetical protein